MKLNEFQNKVAKSLVAQEVDEETATVTIPVEGTVSFRRLISSVANDLIAAAITCEKVGITLEYVCEVALATCNKEEHEEITYGN